MNYMGHDWLKRRTLMPQTLPQLSRMALGTAMPSLWNQVYQVCTFVLDYFNRRFQVPKKVDNLSGFF